MIKSVKEMSESTGRSITQLTLEALEILRLALESSELRSMKSSERVQFIKEAIHQAANEKDQANAKRTRRSSRPPGFIIERIRSLLYDNPNTEFSTTQISDQLDIPQSTVRAYVRELANKDDSIQLITGRPNYVTYFD